MRSLLQKLASAVFVLLALAPGASVASIYDVTGLWYNRAESGWGANVMQQNTIVFITLFVYGADGRPTWYVGPATGYVPGTSVRFSGPLYATTGPYFGGAFNPAAVNVRQVGTITFDTGCSGCDYYTKAQLSYTIDGVSVTKTIEQQTWQAVALPSSGYGAMKALNTNNCAGYPGPNPVAFTFTYAGTTLTLTDQNGVRYTVNMASTPQYGSTRFGAASFSISGTPAFSAAAVTIEAGTGVTMNGLLTGLGAGNCVAQYAFVGSGSF